VRFRLGLVVGFAIGYYFGARAGRSRYEQMERWLQKARESDAAELAAEKAKAVIDLTVERARDLLPQTTAPPE
jgi:membrane protein DedA with SNARE-associated domain